MMIMNIHKSHIHDTLLSAGERNIKRACVSMLLCVTSKYALFQKVCVKIASSIMPGVKMLRQNFVSASNKSPKDKRLKILNLSHFLDIENLDLFATFLYLLHKTYANFQSTVSQD